jgi:hypothetical protein
LISLKNAKRQSGDTPLSHSTQLHYEAGQEIPVGASPQSGDQGSNPANERSLRGRTA